MTRVERFCMLVDQCGNLSWVAYAVCLYIERTEVQVLYACESHCTEPAFRSSSICDHLLRNVDEHRVDADLFLPSGYMA